MVKLLGHRQTKETATDKLHLLLPRHIPTLPNALIEETRLNGRYRGLLPLAASSSTAATGRTATVDGQAAHVQTRSSQTGHELPFAVTFAIRGSIAIFRPTRLLADGKK